MKRNLEMRLKLTLVSMYTGILLLIFPIGLLAETGNWSSIATGKNIVFTSTDADTPIKDSKGQYATVVYLENLGFDKIGENTNETDVAWLLSKGYRVIELDYANDTNAVSPNINKDIIAINDAISSSKETFCGYGNCSTINSYVLFEGYRIARNVPYFVDNPGVYGYASKADSLYMDIVYPANASEKVPVILSFSYSNSDVNNKHQRLFLGYTLAMFDDSFLEGAPANGMAWAIADHPKFAPWGYGDTKSFEVNPDAAQKVKSAVRTLRVKGEELGLSGKIGIYGFSRGSDAGSMAVGDKADSIMENAGFNIGVSDDVQAAALGSGVFDFTQIYNKLDDGDKNLENLCPDLWGALDKNYDLWYSMGAAYFVETSASAPVLFFYNTDDSPYYQDQIKHFKAKLDSLDVPTKTVINYGKGHAVPQTSESLIQLYDFFNQYLFEPDSIIEVIDTTEVIDSTGLGINYIQLENNKSLEMKLSPNPVANELQVNFAYARVGKCEFRIYNILGSEIYKMEKDYSQNGQISETIPLSGLGLPEGVYYIKVLNEGVQSSRKFIKI